ncbi:MAG: transposase [Casimicrobiaceae bacterium]
MAAAQTLREIRPDDRPSLGWDRRLLQAENNVSLGFVEGLNNKIRVIQRRAYGLRDEEYLRLKVLTCMLPKL